jgi:class 3 adenylate cyclase
LSAHHSELIEPKVKEHRGRVARTTGDGLLVLFASIVDAVRCAVEIQRAMSYRNAQVPSEKRLEFRMGINVGDVIESGGTHGDGVNVAARLEALAEVGGICVSGRVQEDVHASLDRLGIAFEDAGQRQLKNIARPVRVFQVALDDARPAKPIWKPYNAASALLRDRWSTRVTAIGVLVVLIAGAVYFGFDGLGWKGM